MLLFFAFAVFLTGSLVSVADRVQAGAPLLDILTVVALALSLGMVLLILARIFWVVGRTSPR